MEYKLSIDTTQFEQTEILLLAEDGSVFSKEIFSSKRKLSEQLIPKIKKMLDDKGVGLNDISAIEVVPGPGSFTSSRIGVAVANALAFGLNIPVNGHLHEFVKPVYDRPANITMSKKLKSELDTIVDN